MQKTYLIIIINVLLFIGCSSTYRVSNFSSPQKFYENFNEFSKNKNATVTTFDSSITAIGGVTVFNDTLCIATSYQREDKILALSEIKKMEYYNYNNNYSNPSGYLLLNNGEELNVENIKMLKDSIQFTSLKSLYKNIALNKIEKVSFKNRSKGILPGFLIGTILGFIMGSSGNIFHVYESGNQAPRNNEGLEMIYGSISGAIIGGLAGWLIGYNYTYVFNP